MIKVSADAATPEDASRLANTWLRGVVAQVSALENAGADAAAGTSGSIVQLVPVDSAVLPTSPSSPNVRLALALGGLIGLAGGIGYAASTGKATYEQLRKAVGHLERVQSRALGIILNRVSLRGPDRSEYYQYDYAAKKG